MLRKTFHALRRAAPWAVEPLYVRRRRAELRRWVRQGHFDPNPQDPAHFDDYERASPGREIPRVLHQTWKTADLPAEFAANVRGFEALHPAWRRVLWSDAAMEQLVRQHFPQYLAAYLALPRNIMRADLFRYMVLFVHGGLYSDLDVVFLRPHDDLIADCALLLGAETDDTAATPFVAQHMIGSCPRHEFWADLLREALGRPLDEVRAYADPLDTTGPFFVTRVWRANRQKYRAKILKMAYLCAPAWMTRPEFALPEAAHSVHACVGSWR